RMRQLQDQTKLREEEFLRALREAPDAGSDWAGMQASTPVTLQEVRAALQTDTALAEYFCVRGRYFVAVVTKKDVRLIPLTPVTRIRNILRMLQFQLSKFRLGTDYMATFQDPLLEATQTHLRDLYTELLAPVLNNWQGKHLIIVPHDCLHYL